MFPESKAPPSAVTVWGIPASLLVQVTVLPWVTVTAEGAKASPAMLTDWLWARAGSAAIANTVSSRAVASAAIRAPRAWTVVSVNFTRDPPGPGTRGREARPHVRVGRQLFRRTATNAPPLRPSAASP